MTTGRIIGLDVGDVRIGVAVSDPLGSMALPRPFLQRRNEADDIAKVRALMEETGADRIVVGLPLNQHGDAGPQAERVLRFAKRLTEELGVNVDTQDERYSTASAERTLVAANVRRKDRKTRVDSMAAQHILQTYMDRRGKNAP